jgi:hypothetical protein
MKAEELLLTTAIIIIITERKIPVNIREALGYFNFHFLISDNTIRAWQYLVI